MERDEPGLLSPPPASTSQAPFREGHFHRYVSLLQELWASEATSAMCSHSIYLVELREKKDALEARVEKMERSLSVRRGASLHLSLTCPSSGSRTVEA
jgi:hypothetical protein